MYTLQDYALFFLAIIFLLIGLAMLGTIIEWQENRKAQRRKRQLHNLNCRKDFRRRHANYLAQMQEVLDNVERRRSA